MPRPKKTTQVNMPSKKTKSQKKLEEEARTCLWMISHDEAKRLHARIMESGFHIKAHVEGNLIHLHRDLTKEEHAKFW